MATTVGFIGIGRLGLPFAANLVGSGYDVVCCARGRSAELVEHGGRNAGDGSPRAVAEAADGVVLTCLPDDDALDEVVSGLLEAGGAAPIVVEMSTVSIAGKQRNRDRLATAGGDLLD